MADQRLLARATFWALGLIWGSNFIFMNWAAELISPMQIVFLRVLFGFLPVAAYAWATGALRRAHLRYSGHFLVMSLLATAIYYFGFAKGTSLLLSGIAGALSGSIPLFAFAAGALFLRDEPITGKKLAGVTIGFLGVLLIADPFAGDAAATNLEGVFYMGLGSLSIGLSFVYAKRFLSGLDIKPAALTTYQLGFAILILSLATDFTGIGAVWGDTRAAAGLVVGLGLLGTGLAYIAYYLIVRRLGAIAAASVTYIPPVVALFVGAGLVGEDIALIAYPATAMIFAGVWLLNAETPKRPVPHSSE